ncbi:hypothetical protein HC928_07005 [bacterium]|nr:hypothetical protein [bacterium]
MTVKPLQLSIPSFRQHGYGNWGFFFGSPVPILRAEIEGLILPDRLQALRSTSLLEAFIFQVRSHVGAIVSAYTP